MNKIDTGLAEDWYLVFIDATYDSWFMRTLQPGFKHVYAMKLTEGGNFWQVVDPLRPYLKISQELVSLYPHPRAFAGPDAIILPITAKIDRSGAVGTLSIFTCVDVVKGLIGIRAPLVFTPWQLYKYIKRVKP